MQVPSKAVILMYHRIAHPRLDPWGLCVRPENFGEQLQAIRRIATPMSLDAYVAGLREGGLPERAVVVTFDDGYLDNLEQAQPMLAQQEVPATLFVATCNIDSDREFWWDRLETMLLGPSRLPDSLRLELPDGVFEWQLGQASAQGEAEVAADRRVSPWEASPSSRLGFFYAVWKALWPLADAPRDVCLRALADWSESPATAATDRRTMRSGEIRTMDAAGVISIGAHTVDHPPLPAHPEALQRAQIRGAREQLSNILGRPVTSFAYPHGEHSAQTIRLLHDEGFDCAVTVEQKLAVPGTDPMKLPRFGVRDVGGFAFQAQLGRWFASAEAAA